MFQHAQQTPKNSNLFHFSFSIWEVLVDGQAVEEDLERLVYLSHLIQHHSFPEQRLEGWDTNALLLFLYS